MTPSLHSETPLSGQILVVDDEPSVLAIAAAILNTIEVTPLKARNGEEALATVQSEYASGRKIALVIQDLTMPGGMSGFETMEALRDLDPEIRVIACSGFFQDDALELCRSIGFSNILAKPYTPDSLLGLIRRTLHEPAPQRLPKQQPNSETRSESRATFTPAASTAPAAPVATFGMPSFQDDEDEDDDATEDTHALHPALSHAPEVPSEATSEPAAQRRPSFLTSALAQSIRSRLQPHRNPSESPAMEPSSVPPSE
jgi:CheY-like chemotaxis protein